MSDFLAINGSKWRLVLLHGESDGITLHVWPQSAFAAHAILGIDSKGIQIQDQSIESMEDEAVVRAIRSGNLPHSLSYLVLLLRDEFRAVRGRSEPYPSVSMTTAVEITIQLGFGINTPNQVREFFERKR